MLMRFSEPCELALCVGDQEVVGLQRGRGGV